MMKNITALGKNMPTATSPSASAQFSLRRALCVLAQLTAAHQNLLRPS